MTCDSDSVLSLTGIKSCVSLTRAVGRDSIGDSTISGDLRWGGSLGVNVDYVARSHCSVEFIPLEDMQVFAIFILQVSFVLS